VTARSGTAEVVWAPWPHRAGFCITDDTDAADLQSVRVVYDFLRALGLRTTKTVWAFVPEEPCGIPATPPSTLRGITLEDADYRAYCQGLAADGFEVCLHGASAGNNRRERTVAALDLAERLFDQSGTFVCHSKNADNLYWEEKTAPNAALRTLLLLYSRHRCSGEVEGSPYFWGDICRERIRWVRLFRTRNPNTLADNPSMPYVEPGKPWVKGWFAATKRSFHDCTTPEALDRLARHHGLTVLYQYLHRYASAGEPDLNFRTDAERLASDDRILVAPVADVLGRLQQLQRVFFGYHEAEVWVFNAGNTALNDLQLRLPHGVYCTTPGTTQRGRYLRLRVLPANNVLHLAFDRSVRFTGSRTIKLNHTGRGRSRIGTASIYLNTSLDAWRTAAGVVQAESALVVPDPGWAPEEALAVAPQAERIGLFFRQMAIIVRELLTRKRSLSTERFLGAETIPLEDHANW